jgi:hypothetical protein
MFDTYFKPAAIKAGAEPVPRPGTAPVQPVDSFGPGILGFAEQRLAEEVRRRRDLATGPAGQPPPGMPGYDPAWDGQTPRPPRPAGYAIPTAPVYGYQDRMAMRNSAGL